MGFDAKQCQWSGCTATAEHHPVILVRAVRGGAPARAVVGVRVCGICKARLKVADVLTDELWRTIVKLVADGGNKVAPVREISGLTFCGLNSREARAMRERRAS